MKEYKFNFRGRELVVELGRMAKQADASVITKYGDTVVLTTVVHSREPIDRDFFPLMVIYQEKLYAVGKIPGGFIKREGRPTDNATLASRLIDRPIRPLWPKGFHYDVQVVNTVLSVDRDNSPEMAAMFGSSLALKLTGLPFDGPIAGVNVGRINNEFIINPTTAEVEASDLELTVAGNVNAINMVEAAAKEVSEEDMIDAMMFGHEAIKELIDFQNEIVTDAKPEAFKYELFEVKEELI
jgi:polyribonucleotide nucleotidyltransferase